MKNVIDWIALVLVIVGGLNWGLVGAFSGFNLVESIFGTGWFTNTVYSLVGLSALWMIYYATKD